MLQRKWSLDSTVIDFAKFFLTVLITGHLLACTFFLLPALIEPRCSTKLDVARGPINEHSDVNNEVGEPTAKFPLPRFLCCCLWLFSACSFNCCSSCLCSYRLIVGDAALHAAQLMARGIYPLGSGLAI